MLICERCGKELDEADAMVHGYLACIRHLKETTTQLDEQAFTANTGCAIGFLTGVLWTMVVFYILVMVTT